MIRNSFLGMTERQFRVALHKACVRHGIGIEGEAALYGNAYRECGGNWNPEINQRDGNAKGHFQFDGALKQAFESNYPDWRTESQLDFVLSGCKDFIGAGNYQKMMKSLQRDRRDIATEVFCNIFEKPGVPAMDQRKAAAARYRSEL